MDTWEILIGGALLWLIGFLTWHFATYGLGTGFTMYPFLGIAPELLWHFPDLFEHITRILERSPSMASFGAFPGAKWLFTANPAHLQHILKDNFANYPKGPAFSEIFEELLGEGIFASDADAWRQQRKVASYEFSTASLRNMMLIAIHDEVHSRLLPTLASLAASGQAFDVQDVFLRYTFDNICRVGLGADPHALSPDFPHVQFAACFDRAARHCTLRALLPSALWKGLRALGCGYEGQFAEDIHVVRMFADEVIKTRMEELAAKERKARDPPQNSREVKGVEAANLLNGSHAGNGLIVEGNGTSADRAYTVEGGAVAAEVGQVHGVNKAREGLRGASPLEHHSDLLTRMIALGERDHGQLFSGSFLRDACLNFIIAGRDTSAATLTWLFWLLSQHPKVEQRMMEEVESIVSARDPSDRDRPFSFEELRKMTYVHAAINETLRLYPSVPVDMKCSINEDMFPDGTRVGPGWRVIYSIYSLGRMTRVWGEDAREFKPERWLTPSCDVRMESPFKFLAFNAGPRLCLGKDMAYFQIKSVASSILLRYHLRLVPAHPIVAPPSVTLLMQKGLVMTVHRR